MQHLSRQLTKGIVMETVGEFKKAGLVFVGNDMPDGIMKVSSKGAASLNAKDCFDGMLVVGEFAWRENTGVKPEFIGAIDAIIRVGDNVEQFNSVISVDIFSWSLVIKWRPSLNQPSVAELDTKQSAIHKAWMDLQGDLSNAEKHDRGGRFLVVCIKDGISIKKGEYQIASHTTNNTEYWENVCAIPEFTDYCEKMAAEEKRMDIIGQNGNDGLHYGVSVMDDALNAIDAFKSEKSKPIFTQAMADNGELPPVGSLFIDIEYNESKQVLALAHHLGKVVYAADYDDVSQVDYFHADQDECKPIDMRTEIDKAIDAAMTDIDAERGDRASVAGVVERMIAAGYSKC